MKEIKSYTIITLALIFLCGSISVYTIYRVNFLNSESKTTEQIIRITNDLQTKVLEYEITILSFATTYDSVFLDSMSVIRTKMDLDIEDLSNLVRDNEFQENRLDSIRSLLVGRHHVFASSIMNNPTAEDLLQNVRINRKTNYLRFGKRIREQTDAILIQQREKLMERDLGVLTNLSALSIIILTITLGGISAAVLNFYSIYQYNLAQKASDQEIKDYQNKLKIQIEQLNSTNKELEQFAYVASHDLQEPLRKITSFNDLLQDQYKDALEGDGKLYLERIAYAATRMRKLISDLLEYSRAGRYAEDKELINLNAIVNEILDDLSIQIEQKNALVQVDKLPEIFAHQSDWRMLFQNLISNALKFSKSNEHPRLRITYRIAEKKTVSEYVANNSPNMAFHHLEVRDNGIGFNTEYANKIFTIFQRLHGKDEYEGTGIGLAICKKIVERYGGTIFATSEIGKGSSFHILVPFEQIPNDQN
ncbi:sensor histidine kinase [Lunatibacter salilacus]|uniref:sensor histidine kinase n=1 Tax=Lunatibacter salilacus TaxID=2483804 RepID=UPI00131D3965|nr:ATP-binding protein [Lunatibacter salilacus]